MGASAPLRATYIRLGYWLDVSFDLHFELSAAVSAPLNAPVIQRLSYNRLIPFELPVYELDEFIDVTLALVQFVKPPADPTALAARKLARSRPP